MPDASPAESIFFAALDRPPADRSAFLDAACRGDAGLRARIEKMLAAQPDLGEFLGRPDAMGVVNPEQFRDRPSPPDLTGVVVAGKYELTEPIGEGGMGAVWLAEQLHPVRRQVAVKLIRGEYGGSRDILARFEAERQAIARMDHPHIAKLLDAGTTGDAEATSVGSGRPYFVMELVHGVPLNEYCDRHRLTIADRLRLFVQICGAVQHAHQKGIIHRDLKPSNILVEHRDGRPVPRVIDFGLAKATGRAHPPDETLLTRPGMVTGTPLYMAPEQAAADAADVDTRADVYALGVNLYELLTGTTPIERERLKQVPLHELLHVIRDSDPPTPSRRPSPAGAAAKRRTEPLKLGRFLRGELDWIVMKALAKERDRRYETAAAFAGDVERFLNHEPVLAGPPSAIYRLGKFVRRNRVQVVAAGLVLLALVTGIAGTTFGLIRAESRREEAERARRHEAAQRVRAEQARNRTWDALEAMTSWVTGKSLSTQPVLTDEQKNFLGEVLAYYREFAAEQADDEPSRDRTAAAADRVGAIEYRLGRTPQAVAAIRVARDGFARLVADFPAVPEHRHRLAGTHNVLGIWLRELGQLPEAEDQIRTALSIWGELAVEFPAVPAHRQHLADGHNNLGVALQALGKPTEAMGECLKAIAIQEKLAAEFPADPEHRRSLAYSHSNISGLLKMSGNPTAAVEHIRRALAIQEKLADDFPAVPDLRAELAGCHSNLGVVLNGLGDPGAAGAEHRKALAILEKLAAEFPGVPEYRRERAMRHFDLGLVLGKLRRRPEAEGQFRKAIALLEPLAVEFPLVPVYRQQLAATHSLLGELLRGQGKRPEAEEQFRTAIAVRQKLAPEVPALHEVRDQLATDHNTLGQLLVDRERQAEGEEQFRLALTVREKLAADFPAVTVYQTRLGGTACNFGRWLVDRGRSGESLAWLDLAVRALTANHERDRQSVVDRDFLCNSHASRALAYHSLRKYGEALTDWDRAIELDPAGRKPWARACRASSRVNAGQVAEAVAEADELTKSSDWDAGSYCELAGVYAQASGRVADKAEEYGTRAVELLRRAAKAGFRDADWLAKNETLAPLRVRDDFKKLLAQLQK